MVVFVSLVLLGIADRAEAEMRKFTLINVLLDGTKIWLPSVLIVYEGDEVELTLINKLDEPHGFKIATVGVEAVVEPKATTTVRFTAKKEVIDSFVCHLHPPHIGGQLLVIEK
jgi:heme/copper-type cytochrome/quinol oxidase subunit 2